MKTKNNGFELVQGTESQNTKACKFERKDLSHGRSEQPTKAIASRIYNDL
jgi:hypothetical protein